jgi:hypothetical protein
MQDPPEDITTDEADAAEELQQLHFALRHDLQKRVDIYLRDRLPGYSRQMGERLG